MSKRRVGLLVAGLVECVILLVAILRFGSVLSYFLIIYGSLVVLTALLIFWDYAAPEGTEASSEYSLSKAWHDENKPRSSTKIASKVTPISTVTSIDIQPASPASLAVGSTLQFVATVIYADGSSAVITSQVTWASSDTTIATISPKGLVTGVADGSINITASLSGITSPVINLKVVIPLSTAAY
jgi:hypothetical protein